MSYLQITSGRGPAECQRAVWHMVQFLKGQGYSARLVEHEEGDHRECFKSAIMHVKDANAEESLIGSHEWISASPFRPHHKRKRWFFGIERLPEPDELNLNMDEVRVDVFRSSGPGGQHVNTTDSAVRVTWIPQGIQVVAGGERSQRRNRDLAMARLQKEVERLNQAKRGDKKKEAWDSHNNLARGMTVLSFEGPTFRLLRKKRRRDKTNRKSVEIDCDRLLMVVKEGSGRGQEGSGGVKEGSGSALELVIN